VSDEARILVVDDDRSMANTLSDILNVKGYRADAVYSGAEALERVEEQTYHCVLTDIKMPRINGAELYGMINEIRPELPVVFMTAYAAEHLVRNALEEGAIACLAKPLDINLLIHFFSSLKKERSVVIVDDDPAFSSTLRDILRARGFSVFEIGEPTEVIEALTADIQVVLLDLNLDGVNGVDVLKNIRSQAPDLPVVLVTGYREEMTQAIEDGLRISAYTCLYKPFEIEELLQVLTEVRHQEMGRMLGRRPRAKGR